MSDSDKTTGRRCGKLKRSSFSLFRRVGDDSSLINLEDYLESFKDGRSFPHHLSTIDGARALMEHVLTACKLRMFPDHPDDSCA